MVWSGVGGLDHLDHRCVPRTEELNQSGTCVAFLSDGNEFCVFFRCHFCKELNLFDSREAHVKEHMNESLVHPCKTFHL